MTVWFLFSLGLAPLAGPSVRGVALRGVLVRHAPGHRSVNVRPRPSKRMVRVYPASRARAMALSKLRPTSEGEWESEEMPSLMPASEAS